MKIILAFTTALLLYFQSGDLTTLRNSYTQANSSNTNTQSFITTAGKQSGSNATILGYKAAAKIMEAKIAKKGRPALVKEGATSLESVIAKNPNNMELRVIRLSIQENLPKIVGYRSSIKTDKTYILANYSKQSADLKSYIKKYAAQSKSLTLEEKSSLK